MRPSLPDLTAVPTQPDPAGVASWHEYPGSALLGAVRGTRFATAAGDALDLARLPERAMRQTADEGLRRAAGTLSGVRLEFDTRAGRIDLVVHIRRHVQSTAAPPGLAAIFVATIDDVDVDRVEQHEGSVVILEPDGGTELHPGSDTRISLALPGAPASRTVEVWLPHNAHVRIHSIRADAPIGPSSLPQRLRWTHYGSSISHCVTADGPTGVWPVLAARRLGWDVTSFAVAGQAMLDPFVARAIAAQPADLVTLKVGINLVNHAAMSLRTFEPALHGFVDVIRDQQPETPIVLISPIYSPLHERTPGPLVRRPDNSLAGSPQNEGPGALTLVRVREAVERVVATREDSTLAYLSGLEILGEVDAHLLVDRLHPDAAGYRIVGERFATLARARGWGGVAA